MSGYCSSIIIYYFICIINFCENAYYNIHKTITSTVNRQLEGRVLYYAMYTKGTQENYYTQLYNVTSLFDRLKLIILSYIYHNYYEKNSVFSYTEVYTNIENLTSFMIDAVIVSYVKNGSLETKILSYKEEDFKNNSNDTANSVSPRFVFAIVVDKDGEEITDFSRELNQHIDDVKNSPLTVSDFIYILKSKYQKTLDDENNFKLKVMMDNDFNEVLYNSTDKLEI